MRESFRLRGAGIIVALTVWSCAGGTATSDAGHERDGGVDAGALDSGATEDMDAGVDGGQHTGSPFGPTLAVTPDATLAFGTLGFIPGAPLLVSTRAFFITNTGPRASPADVGANLHLDVHPFSITAVSGALNELCIGDFDRASDTCSNTFTAAYDPNIGIEGGRGLQLLVHVVPRTTGHKAFELVLFTNDGTTPEKHLTVTADVVQTASCDFTATPSRVDFGLVTDGGVQTKTFTLHNAGTDVCYFDSFAVSPSDNLGFSLAAPFASVPVAPGDDAVITTSFAATPPAVLTPWAAAVRFSVAMTAASSSQVPLEVTLAPPCLSITPDALTFGDVAQGCAAVLPITVHNACVTPVTWSGARLTDAANTCTDDGGCPQFSLENVPPGSVIAAGQQRAFDVRFTPRVQMNATGPAAAVHLALSGNGVPGDGGCDAP